MRRRILYSQNVKQHLLTIDLVETGGIGISS